MTIYSCWLFLSRCSCQAGRPPSRGDQSRPPAATTGWAV